MSALSPPLRTNCNKPYVHLILMCNIERDGQSKRVNQKALTVPALNFILFFSSLVSHKNCFAFFSSTKHIPCLFVALFFPSCFSALFRCAVALRKSFFLFIRESKSLCTRSNCSKEKTTDSSFIRTFWVLVYGRSVEAERASEMEAVKIILKISPTSDRFALAPHYQKEFTHIFFLSPPLRATSDTRKHWRLLVGSR